MFKVHYQLATLCKTKMYKFVCICIFIYYLSVYVWDEGACVSMCMYEKVRNVFSGLCILTCVGDSDKTTILDKCHGLWSNSLLPHGISVSDGGFAFTHLTRSEKQYQTGLRPLVCSQLEFATPFTLVMHQSHIWKKRKRDHINMWLQYIESKVDSGKCRSTWSPKRFVICHFKSQCICSATISCCNKSRLLKLWKQKSCQDIHRQSQSFDSLLYTVTLAIYCG